MSTSASGVISEKILWPENALADAVAAVSRSTGVGHGSPIEFGPAPPVSDWLLHERWLDSVASALHVEVEAVVETASHVEEMLRHGAPLILRMPVGGHERLLLVAGFRDGRIAALGPDLRRHWIDIGAVCAELCPDQTNMLSPGLSDVLRRSGCTDRDHIQRASRAIASDAQLGVVHVWQLRAPSHRSIAAHLLDQRLPLYFAAYLGLQLLETLCWIASWWVIGAWALRGGNDPGAMLPWALMLFCIIPLRMLSAATAGDIAIRFGVCVKHTLMSGALRISAHKLRGSGVGRLMGLVLESESLEFRAVKGALLVTQAAVELCAAVLIISVGVGGIGQASLLLGWTALTTAIAWRYLRARIDWAESRLGLSEELIEKMVGYRTRLAQEPPERRHAEEDAKLAAYVNVSQRLDNYAVHLGVLMTRGWVLIGVCGIAPALYVGLLNPSAIAVSLAGVMMAAVAFDKLGMGYGQLAGGHAAWLALKQLLQAAQTRWPSAAPISLPALSAAAVPGAPVFDLRALGFRFDPTHDPVFHRCDLRILHGERILLEGRSGSGKSTFASVLAGLIPANSGLMFSRGLDHASLGLQAWRSRVAYVPQFHANYIFNDTLAFNLLLGQEWPPTDDARSEAEHVCRELGLGDLIDRMPLGLDEVVGESGWQLSHGERSRIFIARGLIQKADLLILDESTAALDPPTLQKTMGVVFARAPSTIVIAHP